MKLNFKINCTHGEIVKQIHKSLCIEILLKYSFSGTLLKHLKKNNVHDLSLSFHFILLLKNGTYL